VRKSTTFSSRPNGQSSRGEGLAALRITECPTCGGAIRRVRRDYRRTFRGREYVVPQLTFYECPRCGERVFDAEAMRRIEARSPAFRNGSGGRSALTQKKGARAC
jgi:YgiT-type zinc finger domain-containing protein